MMEASVFSSTFFNQVKVSQIRIDQFICQHYLFHAQHLGDRFVDYSGVKSLLFGCQRSVNNDLLLRRNLKGHVCLQPPQQEWSQDLKWK